MTTDTPRTDKVVKGEWIKYEKLARQLERELTAVTEQRDRLAEALRIITGYPSSDEYIYSTAEQALQSLTTNAKAIHGAG
jgi:hypothetical protein